MPVVVQSFRPDPPPWLAGCLDSVRAWAEDAGLTYRFIDDALFDRLPSWVRAKTTDRPMVATDLARLLELREIVAAGETAVWLDADVCVIDGAALSAALDLRDGYLLGRETWVQPDRRGRPVVRRGVHNALAAFAPGNPFLDFYIEAATRILARHAGPAMVPQLIGPKFLTALDNMIGLPASAAVNMASPLVVADLAAGGGPALDAFHRAAPVPPAALNLCQSHAGRTVDGVSVTAATLMAAVERLRAG